MQPLKRLMKLLPLVAGCVTAMPLPVLVHRLTILNNQMAPPIAKLYQCIKAATVVRSGSDGITEDTEEETEDTEI